MVTIALLITWFGYQEAYYGFMIVKGYNVSWRQLANPLHPWQWPARGQQVPMMSATQVLPTGSAASGEAGGTSTGTPTTQRTGDGSSSGGRGVTLV